MTITRIKLVESLYENYGLNRSEAKLLVDVFFEELNNALGSDEAVKIRGFGSFYTRSKKERTGRNPKTLEEFKIDSRSVVRFRPSSKLRDRINKRTKELQNESSAFEFLND